jgi:hypothetical protein
MNTTIFLILKTKTIFFIKTVLYGFAIAVIAGPFFATVTYYPEISIPFACGMLTGVFCNQNRRRSIVEAIKKWFLHIVHDLGIAA